MENKEKEIRELDHSVARGSYVYNIRRQKYFKEFGRERDKVTFGESALAFLIRIVPKWGPLKILKFKVPNEEAEKMFLDSFDETVASYRHKVNSMTSTYIELSNIDWDTGRKTMQGEYSLADKTYSDWVIRLKEKNFETVSSSMKRNILAFYRNYSDPGKHDEQWKQTSAALEELKNGE
jgi:hypothetical protein